MLKPQALRQLTRAIGSRQISTTLQSQKFLRTAKRVALVGHHGLHTSAARRDESKKYDDASTSAPAGASGDHEGQFARTNEDVRFEYPDGKEPRSHPVRGSGGEHDLRTLANFSLEGKVGLITGGARGLGLVMAQAMVISGADVAIVDMNKDEAKRSAAQLLETYKAENPDSERLPKITAHYCDVSDANSVSTAFAEAVQEHGKIDSLVTSAGFTENFDAISYPVDRLKKCWEVNVEGTYYFAIETAKHLMGRDAPGSIVFIGSMSGEIVNVPQPQAPYNAAKAAVRHLGRSLAVEWAHANIRVNTIAPGYMLTSLTKKILDDNPDLQRQWTSLIPVGKMGRPENLMGPVVFLLSDAAAYMTGAELRVDGGYTCT